MSCYKNTTTKVLETVKRSQKAEQKLWDECCDFCAQFGGKPILISNFTSVSFGGITFGDQKPENPDLWTRPNKNGYGVRRPLIKVDPSLKQESQALRDKWALRPISRYDSRDIYEAIGINAGALLFSSCRLVCTDTAVYFETGLIPDKDSGTVEILGSEFSAALLGIKENEYC
jgi:hypothetical protein